MTDSEYMKCEELALNFYPGVVLSYVNGLMRRGTPRDFRLVYHPIMRGVLRGAYRRHDIINMEGRFRKVYDRLHEYVGDGMSDGELSSLIWLAENATDADIEAAIAAARYKGVVNVSYVKAIIEGNRRSVLRKPVKLGRKIVVDEVSLPTKAIPRVSFIREAWRRRLNEAGKRIEVVQAELNATRRTLLRDGGPE